MFKWKKMNKYYQKQLKREKIVEKKLIKLSELVKNYN